MQPRQLRVGLIGTGEMARYYAQAIGDHVAGVKLTSVGSQTLARAEEFAQDFDIPRAHGEHAAVLSDRLDAVVIASATDTHAFLIEQAAQSSTHALCDKPLGVDVQEIDSALHAVQQSGIRLATGFNRRFDAALQQAKAVVSSGEIGALECLIMISRDPEMPSATELANPNRLFIGSAIHDLDMV
ncbi:MAG: Gfo/Idh/MocA family oxidoreductase, partial [Planctomycetota bacterium]